MTESTTSLILGTPEWFPIALGILIVATLLLAWSYLQRSSVSWRRRLAGAVLKTLGFTTLAFCLIEPLLSGTRPRPGANVFGILVDNSGSMSIRDRGATEHRGVQFQDWLGERLPWRTRLAQDFDVRSYAFDTHLRAVPDFENLTFDGPGTSLVSSINSFADRIEGLPIAGALLFSDGNGTGVADLDPTRLPPIYPVLPPGSGISRDIGITNVSISKTNFEAAPVSIRVDVGTVGTQGRDISVVLTDESGNELTRQQLRSRSDDQSLSYRFQIRPSDAGVSFYRVLAADSQEVDPILASLSSGNDVNSSSTTEQTLANNSRLLSVDQGGGPYRVLYLSGRPNWEYKFLRRALQEDNETELVGLVRIARRAPKFDFRDLRTARSQTNTFYEGFDNPNEETAEAYDQPVIIRLGTRDEFELRGGFPKAADELFQYHAIIIDDLEASFFTEDQMSLIRDFVSRRGGGFLMLGGPDSFTRGKYDRTPIGELLPVYLDRLPPLPGGRQYRLELTREGWLQPWIRTRSTEEAERERLGEMPPFRSLITVNGIKPGATVLAQVRNPTNELSPALVAQPYGKGRSAALLLSDLWRWGLKRPLPEESDLARSWRQTVRWLVADVPNRVELELRKEDDTRAPSVTLITRVLDPAYLPLDNAIVTLDLTLPDNTTLELSTEPDDREPGAYQARFVPRMPGPYRVRTTAKAPDGTVVGSLSTGWAAAPVADEFARLEPDQERLEELAEATGGEIVDGRRLDAFVSSLATRSVPITEPWIRPFWHTPVVFLFAIGCLAAEWGLRRTSGLA